MVSENCKSKSFISIKAFVTTDRAVKTARYAIFLPADKFLSTFENTKLPNKVLFSDIKKPPEGEFRIKRFNNEQPKKRSHLKNLCFGCVGKSQGLSLFGRIQHPVLRHLTLSILLCFRGYYITAYSECQTNICLQLIVL